MIRMCNLDPRSMAGAFYWNIYVLNPTFASSIFSRGFGAYGCHTVIPLAYGFTQISRTGGSGVGADLAVGATLDTYVAKNIDVVHDGTTSLYTTASGADMQAHVFDDPEAFAWLGKQHQPSNGETTYGGGAYSIVKNPKFRYGQGWKVSLYETGGVTGWEGYLWMLLKPYRHEDGYRNIPGMVPD